MTSKAKEIGMDNTNFSNSSGINHPDNYSTVRDILKMSRYLIKEHPEFYKWFSIKEFTWNRTVVIQLLKVIEIHCYTKILVLMVLKLVI